MITTEMRAGKPRLEAFKNFATRTGVDDVRALVDMLVQTDRFGTSIAQALRPRRDVADEAAAARRRARREDRRQAGVSAGLLSFPGVLRRHAGLRGRQVRAVQHISPLTRQQEQELPMTTPRSSWSSPPSPPSPPT